LQNKKIIPLHPFQTADVVASVCATAVGADGRLWLTADERWYFKTALKEYLKRRHCSREVNVHTKEAFRYCQKKAEVTAGIFKSTPIVGATMDNSSQVT
jgi:hypothetical protein